MKMKSALAALLLAVLLTACGGTGMQDQITKAGTLKLLAVDSGKPFAFQAEDGSWQGIEITIAQKVAESLGVPLEVTAVAKAEVITTFRAGGYHLAMGRIADNDSLRYENTASSTYAGGKLYAITKRGTYLATPGALADKNVGVTNQISEPMSILLSGIENIKRSEYSDVTAAGNAVRDGVVTAYLCYSEQALPLMENSALQVQEMELVEPDQYVAISVKGDNLLPGLVNQVVAQMIESGELAELYKQYR